MSYFAIVREAGSAWDRAKPLREQPAWDEHAEFMNALAEDGFVVVGGPVDGGPKTLLIVDAGDEAEIRSRLDDDPWTAMGLLAIASIEPWEILLGSALVSTLE
jgi:uncharacterized protein YciI